MIAEIVNEIEVKLIALDLKLSERRIKSSIDDVMTVTSSE